MGPLISALASLSKGEGAAQALGRIGDTRAVAPLIAVLENKYEAWRDVRAGAAKALGQIGDVRAVAPLIVPLRDAYSSLVPNAALEALVMIGAPAVESLIAALKDESKDARQRAAEALSLIGDARAAEPLTALLKDESEYVRNAVVKALVKIGAPAVEPLRVLLKDVDGFVRIGAAGARGLIGDARAAEPLIAPFNDESESVRDAALEALVRIGAPAVEPLSVVLVKDEDKSARVRAANALGRIGNARAVNPLVTVLGTEEDSEVREAAAEALAQIGDRRAVKPLIDLLRQSPYVWVRAALAAMLETLEGEPDLGHIGAMYWVSVGQWDRCRAVGAAAVPALAAVLRAGVTEAGHQHGSPEDPGGLPSFTPVLKERRAREQRAKERGVGVRAAAASALGRVSDASGAAFLIAVLRDRDWQVREAALDGLRRAGWEPGEDRERAAYWMATGDVHRLSELDLQPIGQLLVEAME
ncbi:MAG: HEAT repeat domain-containing protein, partial [Armatimonadetes bacterium]|nr:HEAT repeat domain-containing protein [Armatimonadota bacterium]